jgi:hypothetical protein
MSLRSPLATVLGRGTGRNAVQHWWVQRMTALALLPLTVWLLAGLVRLPLTDFATVTAWISLGWNPVLMSLLVLHPGHPRGLRAQQRGQDAAAGALQVHARAAGRHRHLRGAAHRAAELNDGQLRDH